MVPSHSNKPHTQAMNDGIIFHSSRTCCFKQHINARNALHLINAKSCMLQAKQYIKEKLLT